MLFGGSPILKCPTTTFWSWSSAQTKHWPTCSNLERFSLSSPLLLLLLIPFNKRLSEPEAGYYLAQILDGVRYLHGRNIVHRDLKPGNLLLTDTLSVKIGDFGLAKQLTYKEEMLFLTVGTPNYVAPEILTPGEVGYSFPVDIWSMGCLLYKLLTGKCPFETSSVETTYSRIRDGIFYFPDRVKMSDNAKDLIHHMLTKDPTQRITLEEIAQHAFFDGTPTVSCFSLTTFFFSFR